MSIVNSVMYLVFLLTLYFGDLSRCEIFFGTYLFFLIFIYFLFLAVPGLRCWEGFSLVAASRGCSQVAVHGFLSQWLVLLRSAGSRHTGCSSCGLQALEHGLRNCGTRA